jgi:type III secretory pathway component EscS
MLNIAELFTQSATVVSFSEAILTIITAVILGVMISLTYKVTTEISEYSQNFFLTLIIVPAVIAVIILLIGSNVARAFSLAGAFSIIRFRSAPGNPKDITYVLFSMAAGLACGVGGYVYAFLFTVVLCILMLVFFKTGFGKTKQTEFTLKITIPESLNFKGVFDDVLKEYTTRFSLTKIKTADMGSVFELTYSLSVADDTDVKEFMDKLRCKNGNLTILLTMAENNKEF